MGDQQDRHAEAFLHLVQQVEDLRLDRHVERGGRFVRDQQLRVAGQRHRDHHALAHAAGELVRIVVHALPRARDVDQAQHLRRAVERGAARQALMLADRFRDLLAYGVDGVERGHRLLEDEADLLRADGAHLVGAERHDVAALPHDAACDDAPGGHVDQLQDRLCRDGLAAARFADHRDRLAAIHRDVDAIHRADHAIVGLEVDLEALDVEQVRAHRPCSGGRDAEALTAPAAGRARRAARRRRS
jgi:hypothetical protein